MEMVDKSVQCIKGSNMKEFSRMKIVEKEAI